MQTAPLPTAPPPGRRNRFVHPDAVVLPLSDGDQITVRKRLTAGEQRAMFSRMYYASTNGGLRTNPFQTGLATVLAYLIDWTLLDAQGAPVPIKGLGDEAITDTLNALDPDDFAEIKEAIEAHQTRMDQERDAEKKTRGGGTSSSATSPSPAATAGATNG